ncbi:hypothetical protein KAH81_07730, partial [bacterium]|nr:hypothetical protein [bacterium]
FEGDEVIVDINLDVNGTASFDSTVTFGDDTAYFNGPVIFDSTVTFEGELGQDIAQASRTAMLEFDDTPTTAIPTLSFATKGDEIKLSATVIVSDEYTTTPNYNGAKITVEIYDVTNTTVLKSYTVFLQDDDWYEIKEVSISHVMTAPAAANDYAVRCFADGWGNGGRIIEGDLTIIAIQN